MEPIVLGSAIGTKIEGIQLQHSEVERPTVSLDALHNNWFGKSSYGIPMQLLCSSGCHNESFDQCPRLKLRSCDLGSVGVFDLVFVKHRKDGVRVGAGDVRAQS